MAITIRPGRPEEAALLTELAVRSKGHWGYNESLLESFRPELTITPSEVSSRRAAVAERCGSIVGFVTIDGDPPSAELDMLFVAPEAIGTGVGAELFRHAVRVARDSGIRRLTITSDPNAESFYRAMGAHRTGSVESSSIPGRELPLMEIHTL